jgi:hypothetical protein
MQTFLRQQHLQPCVQHKYLRFALLVEAPDAFQQMAEVALALVIPPQQPADD